MLEVRVQETDFSIDEEWSNCRSRMGGDAGAIVAFAGLVRDQFEDRNVQGLELEHYPGMTELSIQRAGEYAIKQWALLDVLIIHRVGLLNPSDQPIGQGYESRLPARSPVTIILGRFNPPRLPRAPFFLPKNCLGFKEVHDAFARGKRIGTVFRTDHHQNDLITWV